MSLSQNDIVRKEINRMLAADIITPVDSPWTSPVVIDTKEDRSPRCCIEYQKLNSVMHADRWPFPRVDEILDNMKVSSILTPINLFQGYCQI